MPDESKQPPDKLDRVLGHLEKIHQRLDEHEKRFDALEASAKEKADEKLRADARRAADAVERATPKLDEDAAKFADVQMRADAAYTAWSRKAPWALAGEKT